jgi:hypothetical protein
MAVSCTIIDVVTDPSTGHIFVKFDDSSALEFNDLAHLQSHGVDFDVGEKGKENVQLFAIRHWLNKDPNALDPGKHIKGKSVTLDLKRASSVNITV